MKKFYCWLFGHDWVHEHPDNKPGDIFWLQCGRCGGKGGPIPEPEGFIPNWWYHFKIWFCGTFGGHDWETTCPTDSGEYYSNCRKCGVDSEQVPEE